MTMIKVAPRDVIENDKLSAIEFYDEAGEFQFQALWDPTDDHTPENIQHFRDWVNTMAKRMEFEIEEN